MALGCLASYRGRGIGSYLMQHILDKVANCDKQIGSIFLHVQVNNKEAIEFYKKFGFEIVKEIENYYTRLTPSNAYILEKQINEKS